MALAPSSSCDAWEDAQTKRASKTRDTDRQADRRRQDTREYVLVNVSSLALPPLLSTSVSQSVSQSHNSADHPRKRYLGRRVTQFGRPSEKKVPRTRVLSKTIRATIRGYSLTTQPYVTKLPSIAGHKLSSRVYSTFEDRSGLRAHPDLGDHLDRPGSSHTRSRPCRCKQLSRSFWASTRLL